MDLIRSLRNNDGKALAELYKKNFPGVHKYVTDNSGTEDEAKDLYQEAFIAVWRNLQLGRFEPETEKSLDGYLYQVAKFKWIDQLRKNKRHRVISMDDAKIEDAPDDLLTSIEHDQISTIKNKFAKLGDGCRDLLTRFYYAKESLRKIAAELGYTEATAKNNKYRCLQKLRDLVKNQ